MAEWLSYAPADFLMFSPRVYWRLFELANAALWPLPVLLPLAGAAALGFSVRAPGPGIRALCGLLALCWGLTGWDFVWQRYAEINWAVAYLAPLFALHVLLLAGAAVTHRPAVAATGTVRAAGLALAAFAFLLHPLTAPVWGRALASAEVVGIAPDPTAMASVGVALMVPPGGMRLALLVVPALWLLASGATLWLLGERAAVVPLAVLAIAAGALLASRLKP